MAVLLFKLKNSFSLVLLHTARGWLSCRTAVCPTALRIKNDLWNRGHLLEQRPFLKDDKDELGKDEIGTDGSVNQRNQVVQAKRSRRPHVGC
jgi:hypothetical protein